jgi:hypothetical protein
LKLYILRRVQNLWKKWWVLSPKVGSVALAHNGKGAGIKGELLTFNLVFDNANRIVNMHVITHFEDTPEEGYLDGLQIS